METEQRDLIDNGLYRMAGGADVIGAVAAGILRHARSDEETGREGFVDVVLYTAKVKAADTLRRWLSPC